MEGKCQKAVPSDLDLCGQLDMRYECLSMLWEFSTTPSHNDGHSMVEPFVWSSCSKKQGWYHQSLESDQNSIQELTGDFMAHWLNDESFSRCWPCLETSKLRILQKHLEPESNCVIHFQTGNKT